MPHHTSHRAFDDTLLTNPAPATTQHRPLRSRLGLGIFVREFSRLPGTRQAGSSATTDQSSNRPPVSGAHREIIVFVPWLWLRVEVVYRTERLYFGRSLIAGYDVAVYQKCYTPIPPLLPTEPPSHGCARLVPTSHGCLTSLQAIPVSPTEITRPCGRSTWRWLRAARLGAWKGSSAPSGMVRDRRPFSTLWARELCHAPTLPHRPSISTTFLFRTLQASPQTSRWGLHHPSQALVQRATASQERFALPWPHGWIAMMFSSSRASGWFLENVISPPVGRNRMGSNAYPHRTQRRWEMHGRQGSR
jgi:hypothetical protein